LAPDTRAISIKVDEETGVSGLVRPGDYVDVVLTQVFDKKDPSPRALSDTVLRKVRIIAIDQEIEEGGRSIKAAAGKLAQTVSLELTPEQVKKITVAKQLGTLSLAVRAAVEQWDTADTEASSCGLSPEIPLQSAAVVFYSGGEVKQYSVKKQESEDSIVSCDGSPKIARQTATEMGGAGKLTEKR
jgi:pilus assembly protein CpaB